MSLLNKKKKSTLTLLSGAALISGVSIPLETQNSFAAEVNMNESIKNLNLQDNKKEEILNDNKNIKTESRDFEIFDSSIKDFIKVGKLAIVLHGSNILEAFDSKSGESIWKTNNVVGNEIAVIDNILYVYDGLLVSTFNKNTGTTKWKKDYRTHPNFSIKNKIEIKNILSHENHVYYLLSSVNKKDGKIILFSIDPETGEKSR